MPIWVDRICEQCGKTFQVEQWRTTAPSHVNRGGARFCSKSCRGLQQFSEKLVFTKCDNCGKDFHIKPYKLEKNKLHFCSRRCDFEQRSKEHRGPCAEASRKSAATRTGLNRKPFSEEHRKHIGDAERGEKNWHWRGGHSPEYCSKFNNEFREYVRNKFDRECFLCGIPENGRRLSVHHIDYNRNSICNGKEWAFVPLCVSCHIKTNNNRWHWFNLLICYWASNPEIRI
jgi:hypothetical protein